MFPQDAPDKLISELQRHIAFASVGPTTLRRMFSKKGARRDICTALAAIDLHQLDGRDFESWLDTRTDELARANGSWGACRKALNLFMRDLANHHRIRQAYCMDRFDGDLELPLDGKVMRALHRECPDRLLKPVAVKSIEPDYHRAYQAVARDIAASLNVDRVDLDIFIWSK